MAKKILSQEIGNQNPLLTIAQGLSSTRDEQVWEEHPVTIEEFIEGKDFLNQKWNGRTGCRPVIMDIAREVVKENVREIMLLLGKGSGKDFISAILHLYGIYKCLCLVNPQAYFGLAPSPIYFINTARNETQAMKVFFVQFKALLSECPWFQGKYSEPGTRNVKFAKNIEAISVNSQAFGWLGFNTIQWVGDEIAFFLENDQDEESESRAGECWEAAYGSCQTRFPKDYKMIGITTPRFDDDFAMNKFRELQGRPDAYTIQKATWEVNPNIKKEDFKFAFARDYRRTMRDFGAEPAGVIESFWPDPNMVADFVCPTCRNCPIYKKRNEVKSIYACWEYDDCTANAYMGNGEWREWFVPDINNNQYWFHFDLAKNKDKLGFCLGHIVGETKVELDLFQIKKLHGDDFDVEDLSEEERYEAKPIIKIDAVGFVSNQNLEHNVKLLLNNDYHYTAVRDLIIFRLQQKGFNIVGATFDQFQSLDMQQILSNHGIETELISLDRTDEIPVAAKYAITEQRVEYPFSQLLCDEAKNLKYVAGKKVDHTSKKSKDLWDSFAGTIYDCERNADGGSGFVEMDEINED
jgi:hypothetical protein